MEVVHGKTRLCCSQHGKNKSEKVFCSSLVFKTIELYVEKGVEKALKRGILTFQFPSYQQNLLYPMHGHNMCYVTFLCSTDFVFVVFFLP